MNATTPTKIAVVTGSADAIGAGNVRRLVENKTNELLQHGLNMSMYAAFWAMRESFPIVDSCLVRRDSSLARG